MERPHVICQSCFDVQQDSWISQHWMYCHHFRAMARRRRTADSWAVDRNVSPAKARAHIEAALAAMTAYCGERGLSLQDGMAMVQRLFEKEARPKD